VSIPTTVYSASMIKDNSIFVCGGEDCKLYKYNYETGAEIGNFLITLIYHEPFDRGGGQVLVLLLNFIM
jgi:hypothetical protein